MIKKFFYCWLNFGGIHALGAEERAAKCWISRSIKTMTSVLGKPEVNKLELEDAIVEFDRRLQAYGVWKLGSGWHETLRDELLPRFQK